MIKDRGQKALALRLSVSKRWLPQMEVEIEPSRRLDKSKYLLTDIDVLAVAPSAVGGNTRFVFDCKSSPRESAIGRAFWLNGVMKRASAAHGFVILNEKIKINQDHRISAKDLGITLLHQTELDDLAQGLGADTAPSDAALGNIDLWDTFIGIPQKYGNLSEYHDFARSGFWMIKDSGEQCRKTLLKIRSIRSELDPSKAEHIATFNDAVSLFLLSLSELANELFLVLLRPQSQEEFSSSLLAFLYGGYEQLETAHKIRKITSANPDDATSLFPEIKRFEHLVREILQAPQQALPAALLAKELALGHLEPAGSEKNEKFSNQIIRESPYTAKFVLLASEYLQKSSKLPLEFHDLLANECLKLMGNTLQNKTQNALSILL